MPGHAETWVDSSLAQFDEQPAPPTLTCLPTLQELRDANQEQLDSDTYEARKADAFKNRKRVVPSGGLAGFRVAPDLCGIDFNAK